MNLEESIRAWESLDNDIKTLWNRISKNDSLSLDEKMDIFKRRMHVPSVALDDLFRDVVYKWDLKVKCRKTFYIDQKQYIVKWWNNNKSEFKEIKTLNDVARELGLANHATIIHLLYKRTEGYDYEENTKNLCTDLEGNA
jgi:hypothetical protein